MLSEEQLSEIREHLERAQNPVFFFDNDIDGLMSFILLRRSINRGKGIAIKSFPGLDAGYVKRVDEFNSDCIFILDKPIVSDEFFEEVSKRNIPIVWIDHHDVEVNLDIGNVSYYNPVLSKDKSNEPVSYLSYKIVNNKEDIWLGMAGCLGDNFLPDFTDEFAKSYSELWKPNVASAFQALYETEFGKLIMILNFALKDRTSSVVSMINFLFKVKSPSDILVENDKNSSILNRYNQVNKIYEKLLERAKNVSRSPKKVIFFRYGGELSLSADLANEISYRFPGKVILVAFVKGDIVNLSIRGKIDVRKITLKAVDKISSASGGGHEHATGARVAVDDLENFVKIFEEDVRD